MKKNTMMRIASVLMVAVLLSTCAISSTFAKYVSHADAQDSARIAKWGVKVSATGNAFAQAYEDDSFNDKTINTVVSSNAQKDVLAPGTEGTLGTISVTGTPEVMVDISVSATLELGNNWVVDGVEYCPLVFTVGNQTFQIGDANIDSVEKLEQAVMAAFDVLDAEDVASNTDLNRSISSSWNWVYNGNDTNDSALGNKADNELPTIDFSCSVTVTQVD